MILLAFGEDRGMDQAVVRLVPEAQVQSQVSPSGIFAVWSGTDIGFLRVLRFSPEVSFHQCSVAVRHRRYNDICNWQHILNMLSIANIIIARH